MIVAGPRPAFTEGTHPVQAFARRQAIVDHVRARKVVSLQDLAELTGTSQATIRRDLRALGERGLLVRQRGGASYGDTGLAAMADTPGADSDADSRSSLIAQLAVQLVEPGDAIALGAGPCAGALARGLVQVRDLTVVTNSLVAAHELTVGGSEVIVTGGSTDGGTFGLVGPVAEASLRGMHVRLAFVSANGLTAGRGLSTRNPAQASLARALAATASDVVAVGRSDVLGTDSTIVSVPAAEISQIITDATGEAILEPFRAIGITVLTPGASVRT